VKTLYLLRHAKSSWDDASLTDHDRPLNERGRRAAAFMGRFFAEGDVSPELIVCSTSRRTRETLELLYPDHSLCPTVKFEELIYEAGTNTLRNVVAETSGEIVKLMLIGHNPGTESLINYLTGRLEPMPTAALAVISLDVEHWHHINNDSGKLVGVFRPRALMAE
jgi:phosphohistidine phosphatase